jgi:hypothetical protein
MSGWDGRRRGGYESDPASMAVKMCWPSLSIGLRLR